MIKFAIIEGVSGAGKDTVIKELVKRHPKQFIKLPSLTSRKMRENETQGNPYYHVSRIEFENKIQTGEVFEHTIMTRDGEYRGMSSQIIDNLLSQNFILLKDCDHVGILALKKKYGEQSILSFFLDVPKSEVHKRLIARGETEIEKRLADFDLYKELILPYCDHIVSNIDLNKCVTTIALLILKEHPQ